MQVDYAEVVQRAVVNLLDPAYALYVFTLELR